MKRLSTLTLIAGLAVVVPAGADPAGDEALDQLRQELAETQQQLRDLTRRLERLTREQRPLPGVKGSWLGRGLERPMVGVVMASTPDRRGVRLAGVTPDGPADRAGLRSGDLIVEINGQAFTGRDAVERAYDALDGMQVGDRFEFVYERGGERASATVTAELHRPSIAFGYRYEFPDVGLGEDSRFGLGEDWAADLEELKGNFDLLRDLDPRRLPDGAYLWRFGFAWSGLELARLNPDLARYFGTDDGVLVIESELDGAPLQGGDVIVAIDGAPVAEPKEAMRRLSRYRAGERIPVTVVRERRELELSLVAPDSGSFSFNFQRD